MSGKKGVLAQYRHCERLCWEGLPFLLNLHCHHMNDTRQRMMMKQEKDDRAPRPDLRGTTGMYLELELGLGEEEDRGKKPEEPDGKNIVAVEESRMTVPRLGRKAHLARGHVDDVPAALMEVEEGREEEHDEAFHEQRTA
mmetsp:Transcript_1433/g.1974  ORF Transcript_1433/g.1974 Transcript_1433/m.1974 type:complete len:140 (-) Transcript_1433:694-1113(-)